MCAVCVVLCVCERCVCAVCVVLCVVLCVCVLCCAVCVCVCVPEHWLSSKQTKLSSKITCHSLALLICWCVCVRVCMCVCVCVLSNAGDLWSCAGSVCVPEGVGKYSSPHQ